MLFSETANKLSEYMASIDRSPITIEVYRRDLGYIRKFLEERKNGPVYIEDVTQEDLEAFMRYVKEVKQYSANTRSNYFYTLRSLYAFAYKKGLVERNIAASMDFMRMPKIERNYLTKQEVEAIIEEIESPLIKLMVTFLFNTGLRISECLHLTLDDEMLKNIMPLLKRLQNAEYQPAVSETKNIPRYQVKGMYGTKAMRMANVLDELARRFSMERNISQREMFEVAVIEFFQKYGYREEVEEHLVE
ncbi:MAG: Tyrosine recombinase XerD [Syntrophomonadaceae bacterium]|nr:Tyrosine recombinase XerD [Bacillota bacterium]